VLSREIGLSVTGRVSQQQASICNARMSVACSLICREGMWSTRYCRQQQLYHRNEMARNRTQKCACWTPVCSCTHVSMQLCTCVHATVHMCPCNCTANPLTCVPWNFFMRKCTHTHKSRHARANTQPVGCGARNAGAEGHHGARAHGLRQDPGLPGARHTGPGHTGALVTQVVRCGARSGVKTGPACFCACVSVWM